MTIHIGTSGWSYEHWGDVLYPAGARSADRLGYYTQAFKTVELNSSFYRWPKPATFAGWRRRLPDDFCFSVKAPRGLTHAKKLYAPEAWVERIAACWHELGDRRAVLLVQLAPGHARDDARLRYFLGLLPPWIRTAIEFRHLLQQRRIRQRRSQRHGAAATPWLLNRWRRRSRSSLALHSEPMVRPGDRHPGRRSSAARPPTFRSRTGYGPACGCAASDLH